MSTFSIDREQLALAIIAQNSMSRTEGVIMTTEGAIRVGNSRDEDFLCMLIPAPQLARELTADGLSSYTAKELRKWADAYPCEKLESLLPQ